MQVVGEPLSLHITAKTKESLDEAKGLCEHLMRTIEQKYAEFKY
jgi:hypothetical protein